jgi:hypothetical protein
MKRRVLMSYSGQSNLARLYYTTHAKYGINAWVSQKLTARFRLREGELKRMGINSINYASFVINAYLDWCLKKGMGKVPINLFLGQAALNRYLREAEETGRDDIGEMDMDHLIVQSEAEVAAAYIARTVDGDTVTYADIIRELAPALANNWLERRDDLTVEDKLDILQQLRIQFQLNGTKIESYDDIVVALLERSRDGV